MSLQHLTPLIKERRGAKNKVFKYPSGSRVERLIIAWRNLSFIHEGGWVGSQGAQRSLFFDFPISKLTMYRLAFYVSGHGYGTRKKSEE